MVKVVLIRGQLDKNGKAPVVIQVNHNYRTKRKTLFKIKPEFWDNDKISRKHPDQIKLNKLIRDTLSEFEAREMSLIQTGNPYTVDDVFTQPSASEKITDIIYAYANRQEEAKRWSSARIMRNVGVKIEEFSPGKSISQINTRWMEDFQTWLSNYPGINSINTVGKYIKTLKTVLRSEFSEGRYSDQRVISFTPPRKRTHKTRLTREEFDKWTSVDLPEELQLYRDVWSAMVYLRGIRIGDLLRLTPANYVDGRILLQEQKTNKHQDIQVIEPLRAILQRYQEVSYWYLFPVLKKPPEDSYAFQRHIESRCATLNLKYKLIAAHAGIKKKVTNHVARHTFASFADRSGLDSRTISKMLNHSSLEMTENYLGELRRSDELDEAAGKIWDI